MLGFYVHHVNHGPGHLILHPPTVPALGTDKFTPARITFTTIRHVPASKNVQLDLEEEPSKGNLTISINDVVAIKKQGMAWFGRILTSWALDAEGAGGTGLEITIVRRGARQGGRDSVTEGQEETLTLKSIVRRNELFGRLISLGEQRWEVL